MGLNRRLERRLEVVLPLGRRPARPGRRVARACGGRRRAARKRGEVAYGDGEVSIPLVVGVPSRKAGREFATASPFAPTTSSL
jgi:hypothetical protein